MSKCKNCGKLDGYFEIDNLMPLPDEEGGPFSHLPDEIDNLVVPNTKLKEQYNEQARERLLKCKKCNQYFYYRTWSPGGSEDFMRTYIYESIEPYTNKEAHTLLKKSLKELQGYADDMPDIYTDELAEFKKGVDIELSKMDKL
jgi:hypothetical protein